MSSSPLFEESRHHGFACRKRSGLLLLFFLLPGWIWAQGSPEQVLAAHFGAGQQAIKSGQFEQAVSEFTEVLRLNPGLVEAQVNLGLAHHLLGDYAESTALFVRVVRQQPELTPANLFLGIGYLKLGGARKAIAPLAQVVRLEPNNREARRALATSHLAVGDYRDAARQFQSLFALEPDKVEAWFQLGRDYTDAAGRLVRRMSVEYRRTAWGHRLAGDLYSQIQRWALAAQEYSEGLAVDPVQSGLRASLGRADLRQKKTAEAAAEFRGALQRDPGDEQARLGLAEASLAVGELAAASAQIEQLWNLSPGFLAVQSDFPTIELGRDIAQRLIAELSTRPPDGPAEFLLAALFRAAGESEKARGHQEDLVRLAKGAEEERSAGGVLQSYSASQSQMNAAGGLRLGKAPFLLRHFEEASDTFAASLSAARDSPEAIYYLARSYQSLADQCFNRMEALSPDSWRAHQMRAEAHKLRYEDAEALREYERAVQLQQGSPELYEALGELYTQDKQLDKARANLEKALEIEPSRARSLYLLGEMYINARDDARGILYLRKALRYDANLLEARAMLGRAYMHAGKSEAAAAELEKALSIDLHGDLHFLLYRAYRELGKTELARVALSRSAEMKKNTMDRDRDKLERWLK